MASLLSDILNDLYKDKINLMKQQPEIIKKEYIPYIYNRFIKGNIDCLFDVQEMNKAHFLDKDMQYDYYIHALSKKKRYSKYVKRDKEEKHLKLIKHYFNFNISKAKIALSLLSEDILTELHNKYNRHLQ